MKHLRKTTLLPIQTPGIHGADTQEIETPGKRAWLRRVFTFNHLYNVVMGTAVITFGAVVLLIIGVALLVIIAWLRP